MALPSSSAPPPALNAPAPPAPTSEEPRTDRSAFLTFSFASSVFSTQTRHERRASPRLLPVCVRKWVNACVRASCVCVCAYVCARACVRRGLVPQFMLCEKHKAEKRRWRKKTKRTKRRQRRKGRAGWKRRKGRQGEEEGEAAMAHAFVSCNASNASGRTTASTATAGTRCNSRHSLSPSLLRLPPSCRASITSRFLSRSSGVLLY